MSVKLVTSKEDFDKHLKDATGLVVVDFYATWCGPCKMIAPQIEELAKTETTVLFLKVDVDDNEEVAEIYKIEAMPTFKFFKGGAEIPQTEMKGANIQKFKQLVAQHK